MSNTFRLHSKHTNIDEWLGMSNGYTSVFFSVLVISGSILAQKDREKDIIVWLAQHDQNKVGIGTVGFDLDELPWTCDNFEEEKEFLLRVIKGAIDKHGWDLLSYTPGKHIFSFLETFYNLASAFSKEYINPKAYLEWISDDEDDPKLLVESRFPRCDKHDVLLSCFGCILCNDGN